MNCEHIENCNHYDPGHICRDNETHLVEPCIYYGKPQCPHLTGQSCCLAKARRLREVIAGNG